MKFDSRADQHIRFDAFELNLRTREFFRKGTRIKLHGQPIDLLEILLERAGELVTREELRLRLWPADTFADFEHILNNNIKRLREALDDDANEPHFIETFPRLGYRFIVPVTEIGVRSTDPIEVPDDTHNELSSADGPNNGHGIETNIAIPISAAEEGFFETPGNSGVGANTILPSTLEAVKHVVWRRWAFLAAALAIIVTYTIWFMHRPPPHLRVTGEYLQLTHDSFRKELAGTDGVTLYLNQPVDQQSIAQVSRSYQPPDNHGARIR